jgi:hypothetical protein
LSNAGLTDDVRTLDEMNCNDNTHHINDSSELAEKYMLMNFGGESFEAIGKKQVRRNFFSFKVDQD